MEDSVIIGAIKEQEKEASRPNHKSPMKPIQEIQVKVDKLKLDVECIKRDITIILDHINYQEKQKQKGWW